jgi:hypothetical protein
MAVLVYRRIADRRIAVSGKTQGPLACPLTSG